MQSKELASSFSPLTLHAVNLLLSKKILSLTLLKIMTVTRPSTILRVFLMGKLGCPTKEGNWGVFLKVQKFKFPLLLDITPTKKLSHPVPPLITGHIYVGKKDISNSFYINFIKHFACAVYFQLHNHE